MKSRFGRRYLSIESLESRQLFAGEVLVEVIGDELHITGDDLDNNIAIEWVGQGQYRIGSALPNACVFNPPPTMIRAGNSVTESQTVSGVTGDIEINMRGGGDTVRVRATDTQSFWAPQDLTINTHDGRDSVFLYKVNVADDVTVELGDGSDSFRANAFYVGTREGDHDLIVRGGDGIDSAVLSNGTVRDEMRLEMGFDSESDRVHLELLSVLNEATILTGAGDDEVIFADVQVSDDVAVDTSEGADIVEIESLAVDEIFARLGGEDDLTIRYSEARRADLSGGGATDYLSLSSFAVDEALNYFGFEFGYIR